MLILPGDPLFDWTLASHLPPDWRQVADHISQQCFFVASSDSGVLRPASNDELDEYLYGGEYDERLEGIADDLDEYCDNPDEQGLAIY